MASFPGVANYLKNVTKSIAFSALDVGKEIMPDVATFANNNKDFVKQTYASIRTPKMTVRRIVGAFQNSKVYQALDTSFKNLKEDITTGNFYNKEREEREIMKSMGFDFDFNETFDGGDTDFNDLDFDESNLTKGDLKIADTVEKSNAAAAQANIQTIMAVGESSIKNARANTAMLFNQNERLFGGLHKDLSVIGATLTSLFDFHRSIFGNMDNNISQFQTESLKLANERNAILKEMLEMQRNQYKTAQEKEREAQRDSSSGRKRFSDIMSMQDYIENVITNAKNEINMYTMGFGVNNIISMFTGNVVRDVTKWLIKTSIPKITRDAMTDFSKTLDSVFANIIVQISQEAKGFNLAATIAKVLGVDTTVRRSIDTSKYEKGQVAWDGISRRALVNVIPGYLRRIESILGGKSEIDYDYDKGKWTSLDEAKKQFENTKQTYANAATSDLFYAMRPALASRTPSDPKEKQTYEKAISEFRVFLYTHTFHPNEPADKNDITRYNYPALFKYYKEISEAFRDFDIVDEIDKNGNVIGKRHTKNSLRMGLAKERLSYSDYENNRYRSMEASSSSSIIRLHEYNDKVKVNSAGKGIFGALDIKDKFGQTIHSYLHNINQELMYWRINFGKTGIFASGNSPKQRKRRGRGGTHQITAYNDLSDNLITEEQRLENQRRIDEENGVTSPFSTSQKDYRKDILTRIANSEIDDLSEFSTNSNAKEFLIEMYRMDNEKLHRVFDELVGGEFNEEVFNKFKDKQFTQAGIKDLRDLDKAMEKAATSGKKTYEALKSTTFLGRLMDHIANGENVFSSLLAGPAEMFNKVLYSADKAIYKMFFELKVKEDGTKYEGFISMLAGETSKVLKKLKTEITDKIINPISERLGLKDFKKRYVDELKAAGGSAWHKFTSANREVIFNPIANRIKQHFNRNNAAAEQPAQQPQEATVQSEQQAAEAEVIQQTQPEESTQPTAIEDPQQVEQIVSDLQQTITEQSPDQPNTQGTHRTKNEDKKFKRKQKGKNKGKKKRHATGTAPDEDFMGNTMLSEGEILANDSGVSVVQKTGAYNISKPTKILNSRDSFDLLGALGLPTPNKARHTARYDEAKENIEERKLFQKHAKGTIDFASWFNKRAPAKSEVQNIVDTAKANVPELAANASIGAGVSLIFGLVGGPLLGAAVGAGAALTKRSEGLQRILFGDVGEDGERKDNGIISKKIQDIYKKYIPSMGKYGAAGLLASVVTPLGPIGGAVIGASIGLLKENEDLREKLFGKLHIGDKEKEVIKKMLPNTLKGAGAGIIATFFGGPFGLVGNAAVGAAIGMMSSTDGFKNGLLGEIVNGVRSGGVLGAIKSAFQPLADAGKEFKDKIFNAVDENIISPLAEFIQPAIHALPQLASFIPRKIDELLQDKFGVGMEAILKNILLKPLKILLKPAAKLAGTAFKVATTPFRLLGKAGEGIRKIQMKTMNASYMTADERMEWAAEHGMKISDSDRFFSSIGSDDFSIDKAKELRADLSSIIDSQDSLRSSRDDKGEELKRRLNKYKTADGHELSFETKKAIANAINHGHPDRIPEILGRNKLEGHDSALTDKQIKALMEDDKEGIGKLVSEYMDLDTRWKRSKNLSEDDRKAAKEKSNATLESVGLADKLNLTNRHDIEKFIKNLDTEINAKDVPQAVKDEQKKTQFLLENHNNIENIANVVKDIREKGLLLKISGDEVTAQINAERTNATQDAMGRIEEAADQRQEKVRRAVGDETFDQLTDEQKQATRGFNKFETRTVAGINIPIPHTYHGKGPKSVKRMDKIFKIRTHETKSKFYFDDKAKNFISQLSDETFNKLYDFFTDPWIGEVIVAKKHNITKQELQKYVSLLVQQKKISNRCEMVVRANAQNQYNSIEAVMQLSGQELANLDKNYKPSMYEATTQEEPIQEETPANVAEPPEVEHHFLGSLLSGAWNIGKSIVGGVSSLFKGNKEEGGSSIAGGAIKKIGSSISSLFGSAGEAVSDTATSVANVGDDKVDKPNDGRFLGAIGKGFGWFKKKTDGSIEPDTADGNTKALVNERDGKQKILDKLHDAQMKASEALKSAFLDDPKTTAKKGMGWLGSLLIGGMLWKTGILQSVFNNVLKPLWTKWIKPKVITPAWEWIKGALGSVKTFVTDTALPWITETALPTAGKFIITEVLPKVGTLLGETAGTLGEILGKLLVEFGKNLPSFIGGVFKGALNLGGGILDGATGSKTNAGGKTKIDTKDENGNERTGLSKMKNEKGEYVSWDEIRERQETGNFKGLYNAEGVEANENGEFEDQSMRGSSYLLTVGNAAKHAYLFPKIGKFAAGTFIKGGNAANKVLKHTGFLGKLTGKAAQFTGNAIGKPIEFAAKIGEKYSPTNLLGLANKTALDPASDMAVKSAQSLIQQDMARSAANTVAKEGAEAAAKNIAEEGAEALTVNVAEAAAGKAAKSAASGATKNKGLISKILNWAKTAIQNFAQNPKVASVLERIAKFLKIDKAAEFAKKIMSGISKTFDDVLAKGANKVGKETLQKVAAKATVVLQWAMIIADFVTGMDQAEAILGVTETNLVDEFIAGTLNCLCNLLIIPAIFPGVPKLAQLLYSIFSKWTGGDYEKRVAEADAEYAKFVAETGSTKTKEEWLKSTKSVTGWIGDKVGGAFNTVKNGIKKAGAKVVDGVKNTFKDIGSKFATGLDNLKQIGNVLTGKSKSDITSVDFTWKFTASMSDNDFMNIYNQMSRDDIQSVITKAKESDPESVEVLTRACILTGTNIETGETLTKKDRKIIRDTYDKVVLGRDTEASIGRALIDTLTGKTDASSITNAISKSYKNFKNSAVGGFLTKHTPIGMITNTIDKIGQAIQNVNEGKDKELFDKVVNGEVSIFSKEYWSGINSGDTSITGIFTTAANGLSRVTAIPILLVKSIIRKISDTIGNIGSWVSGAFGEVVDFFSDPFTYVKDVVTGKRSSKKENKYIKQDGNYASTNESATTNTSNKSSNPTAKPSTSNTAPTTTSTSNTSNSSSNSQSFLSKVGNWFKGLFGAGTGPEYSKQIDPRISGLRYNSGKDSEYQTIGDSGCGPAAAVNLVESMYGRGPDSIVDAARFAVSRGYKETDGGTRPEFFGDYLSNSGIDSTLTYSKNQIAQSLSSGTPTILMGRDPNGVSSSTPFGKTPHYVTVTGLDSNGHAIVQDPESYYDNQLYDVNDLVRTSSIGISASGLGKFGRGKRSKYGRATSTRKKMVIIGDDRVIGMYNAQQEFIYNLGKVPGSINTNKKPIKVSQLKDVTSSDGNVWLAKNGADYKWITSTIYGGGGSIKGNKSDYIIVINAGINDCKSSQTATHAGEEYANLANTLAKALKSDKVKVVVVSCLNVDPKCTSVKYNNVLALNRAIAEYLNINVIYYDINAALSGKKLKYDSKKVGFTSESYKAIFDNIYTNLTGGDVDSKNSSKAAKNAADAAAEETKKLAVSMLGSIADGAIKAATNTSKSISDAVTAAASAVAEGAVTAVADTVSTYNPPWKFENGILMIRTSGGNDVEEPSNSSYDYSSDTADYNDADVTADSSTTPSKDAKKSANSTTKKTTKKKTTKKKTTKKKTTKKKTTKKKTTGPTTYTGNSGRTHGGTNGTFTVKTSSTTHTSNSGRTHGGTNGKLNGSTTHTSNSGRTHGGTNGGFGVFGFGTEDTAITSGIVGAAANAGAEYKSIGSWLSSTISNSPIAKVLNSFLDMGSSSNNGTTTGDTAQDTNQSTAPVSAGDGSFPKYQLTDAQIKGLANIVQHEQPDMRGRLAEASLMANLTDIKGNENATTDKLIKKATGGWFSHGASRFKNPGKVDASAIQAVKTVLVEGKRTVPRYVNEHDCFSDLSSVTNNGKKISNKKDRSLYVPHKTKVKNVYGSNWTFYEFPSSKSDPFGYKSETDRAKWGEAHYNAADLLSGYGGNGYKPLSKYGRSKFGRGNESTIWNWLKSKGYSDAATAGIMGNMYAESGFNPASVGDGGTSFGLCQWHEGRGAAMKKTAGSNWKTNIPGQLTYLDQELSTGSGAQWYKASTYKSFKDFKSATNVKQAAIDFEKAFERAKQPNMEKRTTAAAKYYKQYSGKDVIDDNTTTTPSGDTTGAVAGATANAGAEYKSIGAWLSSVISNSAIAKVLNSFLDMGSSSSGSSSDDTSSAGGGTTTTASGGNYSDIFSMPSGSNSPLVGYTRLVKHHSGRRTHAIDRITPHCVVGQVSAKRLGEIFSGTRKVSSNYGIATDGTVGLYVDERNRSWCSSSRANDQRAVTIECASDTKPPYAFNSTVYQTLIRLCIDICRRHGKKKLLWLGDKKKTLNYNPKSDEMVLTVHRWFANKSCPGNWMYSRMGDLAAKVTAALIAGGASSTQISATGKAADVVRVAQRELNLTDGSNKENPIGTNRVKYNDWFEKNSTTAWCGSFASWVANQAGVPTSVIPKNRSASGLYNAIGKNGGSYPNLKSAAPGDYAVKYNNGKISHIGIVESHNGNKIYTIDGNWSDKVSRVERSDTDSNIKIARPAYGSGVGTKPVSKYGQFKENIYGKGKNYSNAYKPIVRSGQGTTIKVDPSVFVNTDTTEDTTYSKMPKYALGTNTQTVVAKPSISPEVIKSILELLFKIANNTDMLNLILKLLKEKLDIKINANDVAEAQRGNSTGEKLAAAIANSNSSALSRLNTYADTIENDSISSLIAGLNAIAAE